MARFQGGWIKVYRSLLESDIGSHPVTLAIFMRLLSWATLSTTIVRFNGAPREIERGSVVIGIRDLAEKVGCARETAHRHLVYLEKRDTIRREVGTEGTLISIINFDAYQGAEETVGQVWDKDGTQAGREPNADWSPNEEVKNKRNKNIQSALNSEELEACFSAWLDTLRHFKCGRTILEPEKILITRAVQRQKSASAVRYALEGPREQKASEEFDPSQFLNLSTILDPEKFNRYLNLGIQRANREREKAGA